MELGIVDALDLDYRLKKVERQNRWLVAALLSAVVLGGLVGTALVLGVPRADRLALAALVTACAATVLGPGWDVLKKRFGLPRKLQAESLEFLGPDGKWQVGLGALKYGPYLAFRESGVFCELRLTTRGEGWLEVRGDSGRFHIGLSEAGPKAVLCTPDDKGKIELGFSDGEPSVTLSDVSGNRRVL
jgi:hypothetical protein